MRRAAGWSSWGVFLFCVLLPSALLSQRNGALPPDQQALAAYKAKDYAQFLAIERQMLEARPDDPRAAYNVACGQALTGDAAAAVRTLDTLLARKLDPGADADNDFAGIRNAPEWKVFEAHLALLRQPLLRSTTAFVLTEKALFATSVAMDEKTGDTYIASARQRKILKRTREGVVSDFATAKDGLLAVWSLRIDPARRQLIATMAASPLMQGFGKEVEGQSGVCFLDLASGKLLRQVLLPASSAHHLISASVLDRSGNVFLVDSGTAEIYRLRRSSAELELFVSSVEFRAPRGLALSADERTLYVSDYLDGIYAVEVLSIEKRHLDAPQNTWLGGLDGLTAVADGFIAVQTGVQPNRVVHIRLDGKGAQISAVESLESNHPDYSGPLQGTVSEGDFLYVANSQFSLVDAKTGAFAEERSKPTVVLRMPVGK